MNENEINEIINRNKKTPHISVLDNVGNTVKEINYLRTTAAADDNSNSTEEYINYTLRNIQDKTVAYYDSRFYSKYVKEKQEDKKNLIFNKKEYFNLSGQILREDNCDAGKKLELFNVEGKVVWSVNIGKGEQVVCRSIEYDVLSRIVNVFEKEKDETKYRCIERNTYGDLSKKLSIIETFTSQINSKNNQLNTSLEDETLNTNNSEDPDVYKKNQLGKLIRSDRSDGSYFYDQYSIVGHILKLSWSYLKIENLDKPCDWPLAPADRNELLEHKNENELKKYYSSFEYNVQSNITKKIDTFGNIFSFSYDVLGLSSTRTKVNLLLDDKNAGDSEINFLSSMTYNENGQIVNQVFMNGIENKYEYDDKSKLLINLKSLINNSPFRECVLPISDFYKT